MWIEEKRGVAFALFGIISIYFVWMNVYFYGSNHQYSSPRTTNGQAFGDEIPSHETAPRVFYNRMPKCGSSLTMAVLKNLSVHNAWKYPKELNTILPNASLTVRPQYWTANRTIVHTIVNTTLSYRPPVLSSMHVHYIDFSSYTDEAAPVYINLLRDPLERLVSMYYFIRYSKGHIRPMSQYRRDMSYNECVRLNDSECTSPDPSGYFTLIPYFCGHEEICRYPNKVALERAKLHACQHVVIGLLERYDDFLFVLERSLPQFFRGSHRVYAHLKAHGRGYINRNKHRTKAINEATVARMHQLLEMEYEFYNFVNELFDQKYAYFSRRDGT